MIVTIAAFKGGAGRSTLAANLLGMLTHEYENVLLVETSPIRSAYDWVQLRNRGGKYRKVTSTKLVGNIFDCLKVASEEFGAIVVDTDRVDSVELRSALNASDICYIPVGTHGLDWMGLKQLLGACSVAQNLNKRLKVRLIPWGVWPEDKEDIPVKLRRFLCEKGVQEEVLFSKVAVAFGRIYNDAIKDGACVLEVSSDHVGNQAINEMKCLLAELTELVGQ